MTLAPIALVAALRETSVIFGMLLAVIFLHERLSRSRIMAILIVMGGAMLYGSAKKILPDNEGRPRIMQEAGLFCSAPCRGKVPVYGQR